MVTIIRSLARQFRAAMPKAQLGKFSSLVDGMFQFVTGDHGLRIRAGSRASASSTARPTCTKRRKSG